MPIKDLVESYRFGDGLPRFAIIRKGAPKVDENRPGADLAHFRVVMQPGFENHASTVETLFGKEPKQFAPVRFFAPTMDDVYSFWMSESTKTKLLHQCDGETESRWFDAETGKNMRGARACSGLAGQCACKPTAELRCYLPTLNAEIGLPGYVSFVTTSWSDVRSLMACFLDIQHMGYSDLRQVEFTIGRAKKPINTPVPQPKNAADAQKYRQTHGGKDWKPGDKAKRDKSLLYLRVTEGFARGYMLPPPLMAAQLPATTPSAPETLSGRHILTAGDERQERRIVGLKNSKPEYFEPDEDEDDDIQQGEISEDDDADKTPAWVDDGDKWNGFLKSAAEKLALSARTVVETLQAFEGMDLGDWRQNRGWALAAIVAEAKDYDPAKIGAFTSGMGGDEGAALELNDKALKIAERHGQLAAVSE